MIKKCLHACTPSKFGAIIIGLCLWNTAIAQNGASEVYNEQLRVLLDQKSPSSQRTTLDAGGWTNLGYFDYIDNRSLTTRRLLQWQMRGWAGINVKDTHEFFFRGVYNHDKWLNSTQPATLDSNHGRGTIERAWYRWNMGNTLGWDPDGVLKVQLKAGRDFQALGSAFVMSIPIDMIHAKIMYKDWDFTAFIGKTIRRTMNIDQSPAAYHQNNRTLIGGEVVYEGGTNHRPYALALFNWDQSDPLVRTTNGTQQAYKYDTQHFGIGSRGTLYSDDLLYQAEFVAQRGRTYANASTTQRDNMEAYGFDFLVEYFFHCQTQPKLTAEYMYGSGDPDPTSTNSVASFGGNAANTRAYAFNSFGYRDTGVAFAPAVSNLHILTTGISNFPLEDRPLFKKFETGAKIFGYWKDRSAGAISVQNNQGGTNNNSYVGFEADLYLNWRLTSDFACTARYGHFIPGKAFSGSSKSPRDYFYTGAIFSF